MKLKKLFLIIMMSIICLIPIVAASDKDITIKSISAVDSSKDVVLNSTDAVDIEFNDLGQYVEYVVVLKNNTDKDLYVNDLIEENSSEDFIHYVLSDDSLGKVIKSNKTETVNIIVKTLEIEGAGRNFNDTVNLKFVLGEHFENPATGNNLIEMILSVILLIILFVCLYKNKRKNILSIMIICMMLTTTISVLANDKVTCNLDIDISYKSQNLLEDSGTTFNNYYIDHTTSKDVWQYYDTVKNITISSISTFDKEYEQKFDLTIDDKNRITGYLVKNDASGMMDLYIISKGVIYAPTDATALFSFPNVEKIKGLENIIFENTQIFKGMFIGNQKLTEVNIESVDFSNATNTSLMFSECHKLNVNSENIELPENVDDSFMYMESFYDEIKKNPISDQSVNFLQTSTANKYVMETTKNDQFPIYYYRGLVTNNNVIYANKCWNIVRTTETDGIKLVYNGTPSAEGNCVNSSYSGQIGNVYNEYDNSPAYAGYMYGDVYEAQTKDMTENPSYMYGNNVQWDGSKYTLIDTISYNWEPWRTTLASKHHYTCFDQTGTCDEVYYVYYFGEEEKAYYLTLKDGKDIEDAKEEMFSNKTNSKVKTKIDEWYEQNMLSYTNDLEDTVWCNDRNIKDGPLSSTNVTDTGASTFSTYKRINQGNPTLDCPNNRDKFTVSKANGNGALTYPVGMLTIDEYVMAGTLADKYSGSYLDINQWAWTMSPAHHFKGYLSVYVVKNNYSMASVLDGAYHYVIRPSISLKHDIKYVYGTGTSVNPYIIK